MHFRKATGASVSVCLEWTTNFARILDVSNDKIRHCSCGTLLSNRGEWKRHKLDVKYDRFVIFDGDDKLFHRISNMNEKAPEPDELLCDNFANALQSENCVGW